ncbi:hypothetical protein AB0N05_11660 [Nocardia sp. NPDC051030]|uniref:hypothetical protein n=1 Tax=Nocardia sp. NPDC051030 TaxID=3155162 RepID=UPI003415CDCA
MGTKRLMLELSDVVEAPAARVIDVAARRFAAIPGAEQHGVEIDRDRGYVAYQGGWWFRGEYEVAEEAGRTTVVHRIYNVAGPASRWGVSLANRFFIGFEQRAAAEFADLLREASENAG